MMKVSYPFTILLDMDSLASYILILKTDALTLSNLNFNNFSYSDKLQTGSYIVRLDEHSLKNWSSENFTLSNITISDSDVNFLKFSGFRYYDDISKTKAFVLDEIGIRIENSSIYKYENLIIIDGYRSDYLDQIRI